MEELVTIKAAAEALSLCPATLRVWIAHRRIGCTRLGRSVRIPKSEILRLQEAGFTPARRVAAR